MACVLLVNNEKIAEPMKWFSGVMKLDDEWKKDENLDGYRCGSIFFESSNDFYRFEDWDKEYFTYWDLEEWMELAKDNEIIYGYYSEDNLAAEFIHIKDSKCIREYRVYFDDEDSNVDEGNEPKFDSWVDVATYVDKQMN